VATDVDRLWEQAVASLQQAALEPPAWEDALAAIVTLSGGNVGNLLAVGGPGWLQANWYSGVAQNDPEELLKHGVADPDRNPRLRAGMAAPVMRCQSDDEILAPGRRDRIPLYGALDRLGTGFASWVSIFRNPTLNVALVVGSDALSDQQHDRELFMRFAGLARQSIRLQIALEERGALVLADAMEQLSTAAFLCAADGRVIQLTPAAEEIVRGGRILRIEGGRLKARRSAEDRELADCVGRAIRDDNSVCRTMLVADAQGERRLMLDVARLRRGAYSLGHEPAVMVIARDERARIRTAAAAVGSKFGFTSAETAIAEALARGCSPEQIAVERGVSLNTVRTQIRSIFDKAGVTRQAELTRLVLTGDGVEPR